MNKPQTRKSKRNTQAQRPKQSNLNTNRQVNASKAAQPLRNNQPTQEIQLDPGMGDKLAVAHSNEVRHAKKMHKKHQHDHFREDLDRAIRHFESNKESYANTLLYPEVCMSRIPFICPVPSALARGVAVYSFTPTAGLGGTFAFSYIPEAISAPSAGTGSWYDPFHYGTGSSNVDTIDLSFGNTGVGKMTRNQLFPNIQFDSIESMRVVGSSITVTQTQKLVDRAGYGLISRVYGLGASATQVSKSVIINSTYKDEANFSSTGEEDHLRMVYAPADFSDLHMKSSTRPDVESDKQEFPVIQGFITGFGDSTISVTIEFNLVLEYVPKPILYQMVERKPVDVNANQLAKAENLVARPDTGIDAPPRLEQLQQIANVSSTQLRS